MIAKRSTNNTVSSTTCVNREVPIESEKTTKEEEVLPPNDETEVEEENNDSVVHLDVLTVSMALAQSASYLKKCQLYRYLYNTAHNQVSLCLELVPSTSLILGKTFWN